MNIQVLWIFYNDAHSEEEETVLAAAASFRSAHCIYEDVASGKTLQRAAETPFIKMCDDQGRALGF